MNDEEINKTIAEFMGFSMDHKIRDSYMPCNPMQPFDVELSPDYTTSLDALVPVVEKLNSLSYFWYKPDSNDPYWEADISGCELNHIDKSPARALALAIYEVIKNDNNCGDEG